MGRGTPADGAEKADDLGWFQPDGLPHSVVPHERFVFERLAAGLLALTTFGFDTA